MFRFLHCADIHLDSPLQGLEAYEDAPLAEIRGAGRRAFDNLIHLAIAEQVDFVLIAGDLYDGDWKDYNTGLFFVERMGRLARENIPVFIVSGNHDAASQITRSMPLPDNVTLFPARGPESITLERLGVAIHGQSYAQRAITDNLAAQYPARIANCFNIGLLHTALTGRAGHEPYAPCGVDDLRARGYDYWALGHVHQREVVATDPWIVFPGSLQGRHIREPGARGATLVTVAEGRITDLSHQVLDVVRWALARVELSDCDAIEAVSARMRQVMEEQHQQADGRTLAIRLHLEGGCPVHGELLARSAQLTDEWRGLAAGLGDIWLEQVRFRTSPPGQWHETQGHDLPLAGLRQTAEELLGDAEGLLALAPELALLKSRLPAELLDGDEPLLAFNPEQLAELRREVVELLFARLLAPGDSR